jgi:hypothetical protein
MPENYIDLVSLFYAALEKGESTRQNLSDTAQTLDAREYLKWALSALVMGSAFCTAWIG